MIPNMQTFFYKQTKNSKTTKNKSISYFLSECVFNGKIISDQTEGCITEQATLNQIYLLVMFCIENFKNISI